MKIFKILITSILIVSLQTNASERISQSERAAITSLSILSVYESKCADLTPFGYETYIQIVRDQENKGRNIYSLVDYQEGLKRTLGFYNSNSNKVS